MSLDTTGNEFVNPTEVGGQPQNLTGPVIPLGGIDALQPVVDSPSFLSDIDAKSDATQRALVGPAREAQRQQSFADRQLTDRAEQDRERMARSWSYERASANDPALQPWNADQERANRIRGPMEQFGSIGMIFAMAASAFTRTPMTSALNAGAAAMTAIQQGDEKAYEAAYKAWKDNSDLALRRFDVEHRLYEDADKLLTTDMGLWKVKTAQIAAQFDDKKKLILLENGMDQQVLEARASQIRSANELRKAQQGFEEWNLEKQLFKEGFEAWKAEHPNASPSEQVVAKVQALIKARQAVKGQQPETPEQRFDRMMALERSREEARAAEGKENRQAAMDRLVASLGSRKEIAELSDARIRELAEGKADLQERLQQERLKARAEESDKNRAAKLEQLKLSQEGREKLATMNISAREELQKYLEGGRAHRAEMSDGLRREIAQMNSKDRKEIEASREAALKERAEIIFKGRIDQRKVGPASDAVHKANEEAVQKAEKGDFGTPPDLAAQHDWEAKRAQEIIGEGKFFPIDQSIIGELKNYPRKDRASLSYIDKPQQTKLNATFTSRDNLERIAKYSRENPEAIGFIASVEKNMNLDKYQDLFNKANAGNRNAQTEARMAVDNEFDRVADNRLKPTQAAKAKILNKMLTTQAFSDAALAGSRGGTIYLDRAFREIYDQASSPQAFYGVLRERYVDADNFAKKYGLGFDERSDKQDQPFWERFASPNRKSGVVSGPPVNLLKEGVATSFGDKGTWTLRNGKPVQISQ